MRCKLCDRPLEATEVIWYDDMKRFEEWCLRCRKETFFDDVEFDDPYDGLFTASGGGEDE